MNKNIRMIVLLVSALVVLTATGSASAMLNDAVAGSSSKTVSKANQVSNTFSQTVSSYVVSDNASNDTVLPVKTSSYVKPKLESSSEVSSDITPSGAEEIAFQVGVQKNIHCSDDKRDYDAVMASSLSELQKIYNSDDNPNHYNYIEKYDEAFFQDHAVILLFITNGSGSISHHIDLLEKKDGELFVKITTTYPSVCTCDMAYWRIAIEVNKSDVVGITKVTLSK